MTSKFNNSQGSSPSEGKKKQPVKKITPALLFSAIFVAISFIVMLIPLAIFNVTQVAAMLGKKIACLLMLAVSVAFILLGSFLSSIPLILTGIFVLSAIPFFMFAIAMREKKKHWLSAALVLFLPVTIVFSIVSFGTPTISKTQFSEILTLAQSKIDADGKPKDTEVAKEQHSSEEDKLLMQYAQVLSSSPELLQQLQSLPEFKLLQEFFGYSSWQRLGYFVFGAGASIFLLALLISFANVVFVDFGFEQIERLRAIINYVRSNPSSFPNQLSSALLAMPMVRANRLQTPLAITQHASLNADVQTDLKSGSGFLANIWKPLKSKNTIQWQGYSFLFEGKSPWGLRDFSLPFPVALLSVAIVGVMAFWYGNLESIQSSLQSGPLAPFIASICVLSFIAITIVALQGMFTIYKRVPTLLVLVLMVALLFLGSKSTLGPYTVLAVFGAVGLLDYVYDWRGKKA